MVASRASAIAAAAAALLAFAPGAHAAAPAQFPAAGELVWPSAALWAEPDDWLSERVGLLTQLRPDLRPRVVLVTRSRIDLNGTLWYRVHLPARGPARIAWVRANALALTPLAHRIVIRRGARTIEVWRGDRLVHRAAVAVGMPTRPTPLGSYYVTAAFRPRDTFYGAWALETSRLSDVTEWPGGGVVGVHGTSLPSLLGQAVSNGCVRVGHRTALVLKRLAPPGTPITIVR